MKKCGCTTTSDLWSKPGGMLVIAGTDTRRRYRFIVEPLQSAGYSPEIVEDQGGLISLWFYARRTIKQHPRVALVLVCDADFRALIWAITAKLYSDARVVVRVGGNPFTVRDDRITVLREHWHYLAVARMKLQQLASGRLLAVADGVITVSQRLLDELRPFMPNTIGADIPQLVDIHRYAAREYDDTGPIRLLSVANLAYRAKYEGIWQIIVWLNRLSANVERAIRYEVIGGGGGESILRNRLRTVQQAETLCVDVLGFVSDPTPHYDAADVFVYFSQLEGFPNVILEAQAAGLPILVNRDPLFSDVLVESENALFFEDETDFGMQLAKIIGSEALREKLGRANKSAVSAYTCEALAPRFVSFFDALLDS